MNISKVSERLASSITEELSYNEDKKEILVYGIETIILAVIGFLAVLIVSVPFKAMFPAAVASIFGGLLRKLSGGAHFNSPFKCLAFGAVVYSFLGTLAKQIMKYKLYSISVLLLVLVISLVTVAILAPVDCEAKPIHSTSFRKKLKLASIGFIAIACIVVLFSNNPLLNIGAVLGIGYQTMTLLPIFNKKKEVYV